MKVFDFLSMAATCMCNLRVACRTVSYLGKARHLFPEQGQSYV